MCATDPPALRALLSLPWLEVSTITKLTANMWVYLQGDISTGQLSQNLLSPGEGKLKL